MTLGSFLIPAVAGYWFLTHLHFTRYGALRDSGYHVFFRAVITGMLLAFVAYSLIFFLSPCIPGVRAIWKTFIPIPYSGTAMLTALLGFVLPIIGNQLYGKEKAAQRAATGSGDLIELLIAESEESLEASSDLAYEDFRIVIPMSEIMSARVFHPEAYERFQREK